MKALFVLKKVLNCCCVAILAIAKNCSKMWLVQPQNSHVAVTETSQTLIMWHRSEPQTFILHLGY
jgi:hypothetical protein